MQGGEFARLRFPAHSVFLKPFGILAEIRISEGGDPNPGAEMESEKEHFRYFMATLAGERALAHAKATSETIAGLLGDLA